MAVRICVPETENKRNVPKIVHRHPGAELIEDALTGFGGAGLNPRQQLLLHLQRTQGNTAVRRLLAQRQTSGIATPTAATDDVNSDTSGALLSVEQVHRAFLFYRAQPSRYTNEIIKQIQQAVGTPSTGVMDTADVQAVAKYQANPAGINYPKLKVDGMAGPRTLPRLFSSGLADDKAMD